MKTVKLPLLVIVFFASISILFSQTWIRSYSWEDLCPGYTSADAKAWNVIPAIGGGYLLQGYVCFLCSIDVPAFEDNVFWKIDENGDVVWRRTGVSFLADNALVSDGSNRYYCLNSHQGSSDLYVYDSELNFINYYGFQNVNGYDCQLNDMLYDNDGLVFAGESRTGQGIILKTDFQFDVVWQSPGFYTFGSGFLKVKPYNDGWAAVAPRTLALFSALGDTLWTTDTYTQSYWNSDIVQAENNQLYMLGFYAGIRLYNINSDIHTIVPISDALPYSIGSYAGAVISANSDLIVLARSDIGVLHKFSLTGELLWSRIYQSAGGYGSKLIFQDNNGNIIICGGNNLDPFQLIKTDSTGTVVANEDQYVSPVVPELSAYPNPSASVVNIKYTTQELLFNPQVEIYNVKGQRIMTLSFPKGKKEVSLDLSLSGKGKIASGIYFYRLISENYKSQFYKFSIIR
ncbi:MAG: T9SS type A sorting domain-containing protein [Candidatus Cloacimonadaceae bacterium]